MAAKESSNITDLEDNVRFVPKAVKGYSNNYLWASTSLAPLRRRGVTLNKVSLSIER